MKAEKVWFKSLIYSLGEGNDLDQAITGADRIASEFKQRFVSKGTSKSTQPETEGLAPHCPKCKTKMVIRSGPKGKFWGCPDYPACRGPVPIDKVSDEPERNPFDD